MFKSLSHIPPKICQFLTKAGRTVMRTVEVFALLVFLIICLVLGLGIALLDWTFQSGPYAPR